MRKNEKRPHRGTSLIANPSSYVVLDLETNGFDPEYDHILEVGAMKIVDGECIEEFSSFVNYPDPTEVDDYITKLTGITQEDIDAAPGIISVLEKLKSFVGDNIILGHNVCFDINFIYDAFNTFLGVDFINSYIDTRRYFYKLHPDLNHHRLIDMKKFYNVSGVAHRSLSDCRCTFECYKHISSEISDLYESFDDFIYLFRNNPNGYKLSAIDITTSNTDFDETHPIYGKVCVFTGTLEKMTRKEAMQLVADLGGINKDSVTKATNFLILGNLAYCKTIKDGKTTKQKKAEKLKLEGQDIEVLSESTFYDLVNE